MKTNLLVTINVVAVFLSLMGCLHFPIGYYTFLRIVVFGVAIVDVFYGWKKESIIPMVSNGLVAILFNPIIPIYLHNKTIWMIIDMAVAIWFGIQAIIQLKSLQSEKNSKSASMNN